MKTISNLVRKNEEISKIKGLSNTINYISVDDLKKYLKVTNHFLTDESKEIIDWLIVNIKRRTYFI